MKIIRYALLLTLLIVLFWKFDFSGFLTSIKLVSPLAFIVLLILQIISQLLVNYQWCRIGRNMGQDHNFLKMLYINARGMIIESITPGVKIGGEVTRAILLKKELKYSSQEAATCVAIQKMVSFFSFFVINLLVFSHLSTKIEIFQDIILKTIVYLFLIAVIGMLVFIFTGSTFLEKKITNMVPKHKWTGVLKKFMMTLLSNIKILKSIKGEMYKQILLSLSIWTLFPIKMILLISFFTNNLDWIFLTEVTFVSYMAGMIPLLPGGIGSFEATMTSLLMIIGIT
ncbi:MAG: flippase-like domain-containing protein, partial [Clostridiaceae bacterium]|nr:flippase-like domain-containing protein [Clostridiaceae bacterium]